MHAETGAGLVELQRVLLAQRVFRIGLARLLPSGERLAELQQRLVVGLLLARCRSVGEAHLGRNEVLRPDEAQSAPGFLELL